MQTVDEWQPDKTVKDMFLRYVFNVFLLHGRFDDLNPDFVKKLTDRLNDRDLHSTLVREHALRQSR